MTTKRYETDPKALMTAKEILFRDTDFPGNDLWEPVTIERYTYGGFRTDRIRERNRITNALGLPKCHGLDFLAIKGTDSLTSVFLANVLKDAAQGIDTLRVDGVQLWPQTGFRYDGSYMSYEEKPVPVEGGDTP
ncbi:MAG TPA: hypothetical protein GXX23_02690 [Firmicutes bacterium]|nr:hypothetical protein [Candidatus Fermentithermobacillaceae bacterium]